MLQFFFSLSEWIILLPQLGSQSLVSTDLLFKLSTFLMKVSLNGEMFIILTIRAYAHEGYCSLFVCVSVSVCMCVYVSVTTLALTYHVCVKNWTYLSAGWKRGCGTQYLSRYFISFTRSTKLAIVLNNEHIVNCSMDVCKIQIISTALLSRALQQG